MSRREKIQLFRERINLHLFSSKNTVLSILTWGTLVVSVAALAAIVYFYGFPQNAVSLRFVHLSIRISIWFYILKYLIRILYDFHPGHFIRDNRLDSIIFVFLLAEEILVALFGSNLLDTLFSGWTNIPVGTVSILLVQVYFLLIVVSEIGKAAVKLSRLSISPAKLLSVSFLLLIAFGTGMLMLPEMTTSGIRLIDALFTSTSAVCVTGLTTVDTASFFTHKGHWIIMLLIQMGGINIVAFGAFFAVFYRDSSSIKYQSLIKDLLDSSEMSKSRSILRSIIYFSLAIEAVGTLLAYLTWGDSYPVQPGHNKLFSSLFHAISAFNNAGFSLFPNNLAQEGVRLSWGLHGVIALLVFLGGIGFPVLQDLTAVLKKRSRWLHFYKYLQPTSRITLRTSLILILFGAVMFYFFYPVQSSDVPAGGRIMQGVFHSVTARTAGFNTVDIGQMSEVLLFVFMILMFIGASPISTGGGIKTTTFAVIMRSTIQGLRGSRNVEIMHHTIKPALIQRAFSVVVMYTAFFLVGTLLLSMTEPDIPLSHLIFEDISALSTVGLSMGITANLGDAAKAILVLSMFIGRIGSITIILALIRKAPTASYTYSHANVTIG